MCGYYCSYLVYLICIMLLTKTWIYLKVTYKISFLRKKTLFWYLKIKLIYFVKGAKSGKQIRYD